TAREFLPPATKLPSRHRLPSRLADARWCNSGGFCRAGQAQIDCKSRLQKIPRAAGGGLPPRLTNQGGQAQAASTSGSTAKPVPDGTSLSAACADWEMGACPVFQPIMAEKQASC